MTLHDCEVQTFAAGGKGGQNQNTCNTGVRVIHHPSGARGEARDSRHQLQNKRAAFRRMVESQRFQLWLKKQLWQGIESEQQVLSSMAPHNIKVEGKLNGKWVPIEQTRNRS